MTAQTLPSLLPSLRPDVRAVNLSVMVRQNARRFPDRLAQVAGDQRLTWSQFDARVDQIAGLLAGRGVGHRDVVLVHSPNHPDFLPLMYAVWRVGAVFAPTNFRLTPAEAGGLAELCAPHTLVCHTDYPEHAAEVEAAADLAGGTLWLGADAGAEDSLTAASGDAEPVADATVVPGDHAWYFFTSGTSGRPKAAVLTHDHMGFVVTNHLNDLMPGTTEEDVQLVVAPLSHGAGVHAVDQVAKGAATVLPMAGRMDTAEIWRLVEQEKVTNIFTVPTILKTLAEAPEVHDHDHSSLRYVIYAGAPMYTADKEHAREVLGEVLVQYYGLGEVTGNITVLPPHLHGRPSPEGVEFGTCGVPRTAMQISVQDEEGNEVPTGEQGELCVAGPAVFAGYLNNPEANADSFRNGWFRTGDLGMVDEEGFYYVTGRASDMYISGGSNIYPREIEEKLLKHEDVGEVAVLGMPDPKWGEVGYAVCVPTPGRSVDADAVKSWLEPQISRYKMPRQFVVWDEMPKSGYGKIVKRTIRDMLLEDAAGRQGSA